MRIDAHQHFWRLADRKGQWPPAKLEAIHRDFAPADLEPLLRAAGIEGTVLVQSLPSLADTAYLLDLADRHAFILGVVGWADLKAADAPDMIASLARRPKLKGLRPMLQDIDDVNWIDDPALDPAITAMRVHDLRFDALVKPQHLPALTRFAERHPDLPVVIDHAAKPRIATGNFSGWRNAMARLADLPQIAVKLSGLLTEAGERTDAAAALRPYVETVIDLFGPSRTIWGSDWPVLQLAGSYDGWLALGLDLVPGTHHDTVFGGTAVRFYGLD